MRNSRFTAASHCLLAIAASFSTLAFGQSSDPPQQPLPIGELSPADGYAQRRAAEAGLAMLKARWSASAPAAGPEQIFDVTDARALHSATIGDGFETYLVDPQALLSGKRLGQSLYGSGEWRFIVMANGQGVGLVTVARMHGTWTMVEAGASELAGEIASVRARYARHMPRAHLRFVRSLQAVADFIEVQAPSAGQTVGQPAFVPLASARATLAPSPVGPRELASALSDAQASAALRPRVQQGMRAPRLGH